jgi:hypothetical protein
VWDGWHCESPPIPIDSGTAVDPPQHIEQAVVDMAIAQPAWGQVRVSEMLKRLEGGTFGSPTVPDAEDQLRGPKVRLGH